MGRPRPCRFLAFRLTFTLMDKVRWLDEIFCQEALCQPVIVGQSMGGYVGQAYAELFPRKLKGFVALIRPLCSESM